MCDGPLTEQEVWHYRTFGYVVLRGWLDSRDVAAVRAESESALQDAYRDAPFDGTTRHWVPLLGAAPRLTELAEGDRFLRAGGQLYDEGVVMFMADANRWVGDTAWHCDVGFPHRPETTYPGGIATGVKFALYLDRVDAGSGALRLVPGSHLDPLHSAIGDRCAGKGLAGDGDAGLPHAVCATGPGDVVAFDWRSWHASSGGGSDRRQCTIDYFRRPLTPEQVSAVAAKFSMAIRYHEPFVRSGYPFYDPGWLSSTEPRRAGIVAAMREAGVLGAYEEHQRGVPAAAS